MAAEKAWLACAVALVVAPLLGWRIGWHRRAGGVRETRGQSSKIEAGAAKRQPGRKGRAEPHGADDGTEINCLSAKKDGSPGELLASVLG